MHSKPHVRTNLLLRTPFSMANETPVPQPEAAPVGFIDLGTNSLRLIVIRPQPHHGYTVLTDEKETVRLGEGEFKGHNLQVEAMHRAAFVCRKFAELSRSFGVKELHGVATAATREAHNRRQFLELVRRESGLDLRVISGKEEARLIYLGVSRGINLGDKRAVFVDIGGGSTEIIVGGPQTYQYLDTTKVGSIRLTNLFFKPGEDGPISRAKYLEIQRYARNAMIRAVQRVRPLKYDFAVASSGTALNLANVAAHRFFGRELKREDTLTLRNLKEIARELCDLPLKERRKVEGLNPSRADIIVSGAAVLETFMDELELDEIRLSERGLRDGLVIDYLDRIEDARPKEGSFRERSIVQLGRTFQFDEAHARHVMQLALSLFDSAREERLHDLGPAERELIGYAALLHDLGVSLSYTNHPHHSYYFIRNADLLGFDQTELAQMAQMALHHRKGLPRDTHADFAALEPHAQRTAVLGSVFLQLAESLDRSHAGTIRGAKLRALDKKTLVGLEIESTAECPLEVWGAEGHRKAFMKAFGRQLVVEAKIVPPVPPPSPSGRSRAPAKV